MSAEKKKFLFKFISPEIRDKLLLDDEAFYSTTDQLTASKITKEIAAFLPATATITDATACVGGSAFAFSQVFATVRAIEIDSVRYSYLIKNVELMGYTNIQCILGDALEICTREWQDAIFIDCPWGGPQYKEMKKVNLYLSNTSLGEVVNRLAKYTNYIVLKIPLNFDEELFFEETKDCLVLKQKTKLRKMNLLILQTAAAATTHAPGSNIAV